MNNRIITKSEFQERSQYVLSQVYRDHSGPDLDHQVKDAQDTMLANMITELLLIERAQSLLDLDKVRKNLIDDFRKQQKIESDDDLEKLLKEQGMTRKDLEEQLIRLASGLTRHRLVGLQAVAFYVHFVNVLAVVVGAVQLSAAA